MEKLCPLMQKACIEHQCKFYIMVQGKHPQTGADISHFDCTFAWLPILLIENSQQQRQTGAAVESLRNVHAQAAGTMAALAAAQLPQLKDE